jgi:hypothetical protein
MARKKKNTVQKELLAKRSKGVDKVLIFRFFKLLHGRFWGLGAIISVIVGATIGYLIRPDLLAVDIPLSRLGTDVRTAPFFAGSMFFAAYCLWRWRIYLSRTMKNSRPVVPLLSLTILGLYLIALMPVTWEVWPARLHDVGVFLAGFSMLATVLADSVLSTYRRSSKLVLWRSIKLFAFVAIMLGGIVVILSLDEVGYLELILLGEGLIFLGYSVWVLQKIVHGESKRSTIGRLYERLFT